MQRILVHLLLWSGLIAAGCRTALPPQSPGSALTPSSAQWEKEIAAFESSDRTRRPPANAILFIGSSSIRLWTNVARDFPAFPVINRGFGGSQIIDSAFYADRIVIPYHPKQIVFYAGGNDINAGKEPEQVFEDFKYFVHRVHSQLPRTRIAFISSAPNPKRWAQVEKVRRLNQLVSKWVGTDRRLAFIDVFHAMLGPDGKPKPDIYQTDDLHMNPKGYAIWREIVGPYLSNP